MHYIDIILHETSEWYASTKNCFFFVVSGRYIIQSQEIFS